MTKAKPRPPTLTSPLPAAASAATLDVVRVALDDLHPWPGNARTHGERNLEAITSSLQQFGQVLPLVVQAGTNRIIGGNGTREAMKQMGWSHAQALFIEIDDVKASALNIKLNRSAELARWDFHLLGDQLRELQSADFDLTLLGWETFELEPLLAADWEPPQVQDDFEIPSSQGKVKPIHLSAEQREVIEQAVGVLRDRVGDEHLGEGRAVEIICSEWVAAR